MSLSSNESASLLALLMRLPNRSPRIDAAIDAGIVWLRSVAIRDVEWTAAAPGEGRRLVAKPGAGPIWSRFYEIRTMRPIFGDRDRSIHDDVNALSPERRNGYSWFGTGPRCLAPGLYPSPAGGVVQDVGILVRRGLSRTVLIRRLPSLQSIPSCAA